MIELKELTSTCDRDAIRAAKFGKILFPHETNFMVHALIVNDTTVGYVLTEDYKLVAAPHIYIRRDKRDRDTLTAVTRIFHEQYCPLMKARGAFCLSTNCDQADLGTTNFLQKCGFDLKEIVVAELVL